VGSSGGGTRVDRGAFPNTLQRRCGPHTAQQWSLKELATPIQYPSIFIDCLYTANMRWTLLEVVLLELFTISHTSRLTPPVLPLIVRNPYLSTWLGNARGPPWETWPMFYTGQIVGSNGFYVQHWPKTFI